jgi:putative FmdB family regulatory protein
MALYEYKCNKCGHEFEQMGKITEDCSIVECPECGEKAQKQMSCTGFKLSDGGCGWANKGYSGKG